MPLELKNTMLSIETPLGPNKFFLRSFEGDEGISKLFYYQLDLLSDDTAIDFNKIMNQNISVSIKLAGGSSERVFNGFVNRFAQLENEGDLAHYQAQMVPWLWFLTHTSDCLIFQNKNVPEIVQELLKRKGFSGFLDTQLDPSKYRKWDYSVQYRETACNYIMRLLEQEGIYFFFTHVKGEHRMVMADDPSKHKPCAGQSNIKFRHAAGPGFVQKEDAIFSWRSEQEFRSGKYTLNDFNFQTPKANLLVSVPSKINQGGNTNFELYDYPGEYDDRDEGDHYVHVRMDEEEVPHAIVRGDSNCRSLQSGFRFTVSELQRNDMNGSYVLTSVSHHAFEGQSFSSGLQQDAGATYSNNFTCIPVAVPFRPARITPRPMVQGSQTAVVVGPKGEEIFTDNFGRVKVQFPWDREGKQDENTTCFIRVSQPWAGTNWGAIFLPRIGQEVIVDFLEGDPDQPIITGRVYNKDNMPPCKLPDHQTRSGVITRSSPKGSSSNFNSIIFEDKKDNEDLLIHAEKTMHNSVEASQFITVGADRHIKTGYTDKDGGNHGDVKELVHNNHNLHILADQRTKIEGQSHMHVQKDADATYDQGFVGSVGKKCVILADTIQLQGTTKIVLMAGASSIVIDASGVTVLGTPLINLNTPGAPPAPEIIPLTVDPDDPS